MTTYAITPGASGQFVRARAIEPDWPLVEGETFKTDVDPHDKVLGEDGVSLRPASAAEQSNHVRSVTVANIDALKDQISNDKFFHDGHWYWCDLESKLDVLGTVVDTESALQPELPVLFIDTDSNTVSMDTVEAVMQWGRALRKHRQAAVYAAQALKQAVAAGASVDINHPEAVDARFPWPANQIVS